MIAVENVDYCSGKSKGFLSWQVGETKYSQSTNDPGISFNISSLNIYTIVHSAYGGIQIRSFHGVGSISGSFSVSTDGCSDPNLSSGCAECTTIFGLGINRLITDGDTAVFGIDGNEDGAFRAKGTHISLNCNNDLGTITSVVLTEVAYTLTISDSTGAIATHEYLIEPTNFNVTCGGSCPPETLWQCDCGGVRYCYGATSETRREVIFSSEVL